MNLYRNNLTIGDIPQLDVVVPSFSIFEEEWDIITPSKWTLTNSVVDTTNKYLYSVTGSGQKAITKNYIALSGKDFKAEFSLRLDGNYDVDFQFVDNTAMDTGNGFMIRHSNYNNNGIQNAYWNNSGTVNWTGGKLPAVATGVWYDYTLTKVGTNISVVVVRRDTLTQTHSYSFDTYQTSKNYYIILATDANTPKKYWGGIKITLLN